MKLGEHARWEEGAASRSDEATEAAQRSVTMASVVRR